MRLRTAVATAVGTAGCSMVLIAFVNRPLVRRAEDPDTMPYRWLSQGEDRGLGREWSEQSILDRTAERDRRSSRQLQPRQHDTLPELMSVCRSLAVGTSVLLAKAYFMFSGTWRCYGKDVLLEAVTGRPAGQGLLTVCNHNSVADDPFVFSVPLPARLALQPDFVRVGTCAEEICFKSKLLATFFGAVQTLPLERGAGLGQPMLEHLAIMLSKGRWVHIFPEGRTVNEAGGGRKLGALRWGVGKLVVKGNRPVVLPLYHTGMQDVLPQHPMSNKLLSPLPQLGKSVTMLVGQPLDLRKLIQMHQRARREARGRLDGLVDLAKVSCE